VQSSKPDFYNWNKVKVRYCDGSSFTGDVEQVDPTTKLHYRGARIWQAVMDDLLAKGMDKAENALMSGCSAGGLTSILHCDRFYDLLPPGVGEPGGPRDVRRRARRAAPQWRRGPPLRRPEPHGPLRLPRHLILLPREVRRSED